MRPAVSPAIAGATLACIVLLVAPRATAHIDPVRVSLSQLYLAADLAGIVRIESVEDRDFADGEKQALREVVTAEVLHQYKGPQRERVAFFLDAHGPAYYRPGDLAALFLQRIPPRHPLHGLGTAAAVPFVSHQARNTEHRLGVDEVDDYRWVLARYSRPLAAAPTQAPTVAGTLLYMLASGSSGLAESALIDWQNLGGAVGFSEDEVQALVALTRDRERPLNLRLAVLRTMASQQLAGPEAWDYLFRHETGDDLVSVIRATEGHEDALLIPRLTAALASDSSLVAGAAARALAHPGYAGVEPALEPLLAADDLRLNYAAVAALAGIDSAAARAMLEQAAGDHGNPKVRRMISARLQALDPPVRP